MTFDEALELARVMRERGSSMEEALVRLGASGVTIIDSVKVIRRVEGVDLGTAKEIIDSSDAWSDRREANQQIRRDALRAALEEGAQQDPP